MLSPLARLAFLALVATSLAAAVESADAAPAPVGAPVIVEFDVEEPGTLTPTRARTVDVKVTLCAASSATVVGPQQVELIVRDQPEWLDVQFEPAVFTFVVFLPGDCDEASGVARFNASADAPAFEVKGVTVVARDANADVEHRAHDVFLKVGYFPDMRVTPTTTRLDAPLGEPVAWTVTVENRGNAATRFQLQTAGTRDDVGVIHPEPLTLEPGARADWTVRFLLPPDSGLDSRSIDLLVTSNAALEHTLPGKSAVLRADFEPTRAAVASGGGFPVMPQGFWWLVGFAGVSVGVAFVGARRLRRG